MGWGCICTSAQVLLKAKSGFALPNWRWHDCTMGGVVGKVSQATMRQQMDKKTVLMNENWAHSGCPWWLTDRQDASDRDQIWCFHAVKQFQLHHQQFLQTIHTFKSLKYTHTRIEQKGLFQNLVSYLAVKVFWMLRQYLCATHIVNMQHSTHNSREFES